MIKLVKYITQFGKKPRNNIEVRKKKKKKTKGKGKCVKIGSHVQIEVDTNNDGKKKKKKKVWNKKSIFFFSIGVLKIFTLTT